LRATIAWACLAATALLAVLTILVQQKIKLYRHVAFDKPAEVLAERAREIEKHAGYPDAPADRAYSFATDTEVLDYVRDHDKSQSRWKNMDRGEEEFWYRESPQPLEVNRFFKNNMAVGTVTSGDPVMNVSGMTLVWLTTQGKLLEFHAIPPQVEDTPPAKPVSPDWAPLFADAGFDISKWTPTGPKWTPDTYCDTRAAWTGARPSHPAEPLRIEAAAYRGRPVFFQVIGPWTRPERMQPYQFSAGQNAANLFFLTLFLALIFGAGICVRYNLRRGRGDRRGAFRLAAAVFTASRAFSLAGLAGPAPRADMQHGLMIYRLPKTSGCFMPIRLAP
jgi:hypothetical protein